MAKSPEPGYIRCDPDDGHSVSFPDTSKGTDTPTQYAAHVFGVPEFAVGAANRAANAALSLIPGWANGGYVGDLPRSLGLLAAPTRPRMPHESAPGIPCPSCSAGYTYPIR